MFCAISAFYVRTHIFGKVKALTALPRFGEITAHSANDMLSECQLGLFPTGLFEVGSLVPTTPVPIIAYF